ncbi:unnamed protein product [Prorocentrum cordatum]|uniref:ATP-dependent transporter ycf16 n=1 Tax=Prorocentrum cordatum TaxID=2364126 RepID=A0ABN9UCX6_9DINO|nr:unnamed protein product [Polarella glacialis]
MTFLGSRGINISGGQMARICLARAAYSRAEVQLLDDPLAKLDTRVSSKVFSEAILGFLAGYTRVMVTNSGNIVKQADAVVRVDGGTAFLEKHAELQSAGLLSDREADAEQRSSAVAATKNVPCTGDEFEAGDIPATELFALDGSTDQVSIKRRHSQVVRFISHVAEGVGSPRRLATYCAIAGVECAVIELGVYFLALWCDDPAQLKHSDAWYVWMYAGCIALEIVIAQVKYFALSSFTQSSHDALHDTMLTHTIGSSFLWIQGIPVGQMLQMFSSVLSRIDDRVYHTTELLAINLSFLIAVNGISCVIFPPWTLVLLLLASSIALVVRHHAAAGEAAHDAPLRRACLNHYTDTLVGLVVVRAFSGTKERFTSRFDDFMSQCVAAKAANGESEAALLMRLSLIGASGFACAGAAVVAARQLGWMTPGMAGFMLANCCFLTFIITELVFNALAVLEMAREREAVLRLVCSAPQEAGPSRGAGPAPGWPAAGRLATEALDVRYGARLEPAIRQLSIGVEGGEHLGIVGRTGSGKSSLILAICRLVEPAAGRVLIDGVDLALLRLQELREHLGVMSQDPLFFSGTLRGNLDPFGEHPDTAIWSALQDVGVAQLFDDAGLSTTVAELGANFSAGQRQLLCLARASLREPRLVLVDEVTAALDIDRADLRVQRVLELRFTRRGTTLLQVAHRLASVALCGRIAVLDRGQLVELGPPSELLANAEGVFSSMVACLTMEEQAAFRRSANSKVVDGGQDAFDKAASDGAHDAIVTHSNIDTCLRDGACISPVCK